MSNKYRGPGYQSYYGRKPSGAASALKWVIVFLLAVLVVAVGVYYLLQDGLVYDADGFHVILPWDRDADEPPPSSPPVESPDDPPVLVVEPSPEPTLRELALETLQAVEISQTVLLSGRAEEQVRSVGGNAVVVEMKRDDGTLNYVSSVELAVSLGASGSDGAVNQAVRELTGGEVYTVARVSCFRDDAAGTENSYALHTNSGWRWKDTEDLRWTCAANETVQDYLIDICTELAQMGFDEILLTNCGYPISTRERIGWIKKGGDYPAGELDTVMGPFLERVKEALEPYDVRLSVEADAAELAGETAMTGLTLANVLASCDHFWVDGEAAAAYANFAGAPGDPGKKLVPVSAAAGAADAPWALRS